MYMRSGFFSDKNGSRGYKQHWHKWFSIVQNKLQAIYTEHKEYKT